MPQKTVDSLSRQVVTIRTHPSNWQGSFGGIDLEKTGYRRIAALSDAKARSARSGTKSYKLADSHRLYLLITPTLARAGVGSRRDVERMIADGRVALEGKVLASPVLNLPSLAAVTVDGHPMEAAAGTRVFRFHKPLGCLTTARSQGACDDLRYPAEGTAAARHHRPARHEYRRPLAAHHDGELKRTMELPVNALLRRYRVRAFGPVQQSALERLIEGVTV